MKKAFISVLLFFLIFHYFIPGIYFAIMGNFPVYSDIEDSLATRKVLIITSVSVLISCLIIYFLPIKERKIQPKFKNVTFAYYGAVMYSVFYLFLTGGYKGIISGSLAGSVYNYITIFLNPFTLLSLAFFYQKKKTNPLWLLFVCLFLLTVSGSRSGIVTILVLFLVMPAFSNYENYKKQMFKFLRVGILIAPVLFVAATMLRVDNLDIDFKLIMNMIMGRVSFLELGTIPVHYKDTGILDLSVFNEKYGIVNQLKLSFDSIFPGNLFSYDVMPNQYYRSLFLGYSEDFAFDTYMSICMGLPVYFYMYTNSVLSCVLTISFVVALFLVAHRFSSNIFIVTGILTGLYGCLVYFDWVMVFAKFLNTSLTIFLFIILNILRTTLIGLIKGKANDILVPTPEAN